MIQKLKHKLFLLLEKLFSFTKNVYLPGFNGQSVYQTFIFFFDGLKKNSIVDRSYAISYKFILASFPFIIFLFSLIPFIPINGLQDEILKSILNAFPDQLIPYVNNFFEDLIIHKKSSILSIGFLLTIFFASNTMTAVLKGFNSSYHLNRIKRKNVSLRLWSIALIFIISFLLIAAALIFILGGQLISYIQSHSEFNNSFYSFLFSFLNWICIIALFVLAISTLYNVGNTERIKWTILSPGVIFSTLFIGLFSELFTLYVYYLAPFNKLYGSLGTVIVFMLFVYYFFAILLIGFELNLSVQSASKSTPNKKDS